MLARTPGEMADSLTARDLALYQALVEIDGPWWGEREASYFRQLCSVTAAGRGVSIPADDFEIEWTVGPAEPELNLLPPAEGLAIFAARFGLTLERVEERV